MVEDGGLNDTKSFNDKKNFLTLLGKICDKFLLFVRGNFFLTIARGSLIFEPLFLFLYMYYVISCLYFLRGGRETRRAKLFHILRSVSSISRAVSSNSMYVVMCGEFRASPIVLCFLFYTALHVSVWYIRVGLIREL